MIHSHFLFVSGDWIGEGTIKFSETSEVLKFYTRWTVTPEETTSTIEQTVEIQGGDDHIQNRYQIRQITDTSFHITLENELVTNVQGKGVVEPKRVAWEFRGHPNFEGFEIYELQNNEDYLFHAEYISPDQLRSIIEGRIWKKSQQVQQI